MSNHPWRSGRRMFDCGADCPNRKPGCQDHCEKYARDKAKWDERMATERQQAMLNQYVTKRTGYYRDKQARSDCNGLLRKHNGHKK